MKILHLVLYSKSEYYDKMKIITKEFYKNYNISVDTYYYYFDNTISNDYELVDNDLKIKGVESFIPGILDKTIKAFKYFQNKIDNYNYVIRSNISTVINFDKIIELLSKDNYDYGFYLFVRPTYKLASGTSILLSNKTMHFIYNNVEKINYKTIDDTAIGLIIFKNIKKVKFCNIIDKVCFNYTNQPIHKYIIFRNKVKYNRFRDINAIKKITSAILRAKNENIKTDNIVKRNIRRSHVKKINIIRTNVRKTHVILTNFRKLNFRKINIRKVNTEKVNTEKVNNEIDNTEIDNTEIDNTEIDNTEIDNTKIDNTKIDNTENSKTNIKKENIRKVNIKKIIIKKTNIDKATIKTNKTKKTKFFQINKKI